jgi:hypothetical protein
MLTVFIRRQILTSLCALMGICVSVFGQAEVPVCDAEGGRPGSRQPGGSERIPQMLLADTAHHPRISVSWPTRDGKTATLEGTRPYRSAGDKAHLGHNIDAYVALGGTRLERGQGHRDGAIVLLGLYKAETGKLFFENLAEDATIRIGMAGIRMNQPVAPNRGTGLIHLRYMITDLESCGIDATGRNLFITESAEDRLREVVLPTSGKFGDLDGTPGKGSVKTHVEEDGSVTVVFEFPYHLLRHTLDPYQRTVPGGFFEPQHFHIELELLPAPADESTVPAAPTKSEPSPKSGP